MNGEPRMPSSVPTGTYRVQLTQTHGFAALERLAPHLDRLGVSHAYVSPVLAASPGSQHGYDVVDHSRIDPGLGGEAGLLAASRRLREHGIGLVLDVVPNHMAMTVPEHLNRVVWSVLRDGAASEHARWLDVDWAAERPILLPVLGRRIDECLDAGEIALDLDGGPDGQPVVRYFEHMLPVRPGTEHLPLEELLAMQAYRLAYWRVADEELNYRRFFDVDTLVGLRVEDPAVFAATHAVVLRLLSEDLASGLRIDHPDGLADPRGYLTRLAASADPRTWVVVEKILSAGEDLPADWACAGTTGYDALDALCGVFVDPDGAAVLRAAFAELAGVDESWDEAVDRARRDVLRGPLVAEVDRLAQVAHEVCQGELRLRDHSLRGLTEAVFELLAAVPVYRAYVVPGEPAPPPAVDALEVAAGLAVRRRPERSAEIALLCELALGRRGRSERKDEFCVRFQQTTDPAMAKGVEDTAAYRWYPLAALAEVGSNPDRIGAGPQELHAFAGRRLASWPATMSALSTHDTKRSEDVRARLAGISEISAEWVGAVRTWRALAGELGDDRLEWLVWQTLVGAWPLDAERLTGYLVKAAREAKLRTSWTSPDTAFEERIATYVRGILTDETLAGSIAAMVRRLDPAFVTNCLGQRALQLALPGVPDIYQGCESVSLRLVDPDNRVAPDLHDLTAVLDRGLGGLPDPATDLAAAKARLTALGLRLRRARPEVFGAGSTYEPLVAEGPSADHLVGLVRGAGSGSGSGSVAGSVAVVATRLALGLAADGGWRGTTVALPAGRWTDVLTDRSLEVDPGSGRQGLPVAELLAWPVALLVRGDC